jgi:hypothetical protein
VHKNGANKEGNEQGLRVELNYDYYIRSGDTRQQDPALRHQLRYQSETGSKRFLLALSNTYIYPCAFKSSKNGTNNAIKKETNKSAIHTATGDLQLVTCG